MKKTWLLLVLVAAVMSGCAPRTVTPESSGPTSESAVSTMPESDSTAPSLAVVPATEADIPAIVKDALARGRVAQILFMADSLPYNANDETHAPFYPVDLENGPAPYPPEIFDPVKEVLGQMHTAADFKAYFYAVFDKPAADKLLGYLFNDRFEMVKDFDGKLYVNAGVGLAGYAGGHWDESTLQILEVTDTQITVEMDAEGMAPVGRQKLILINEDERWKLTDSWRVMQYPAV